MDFTQKQKVSIFSVFYKRKNLKKVLVLLVLLVSVLIFWATTISAPKNENPVVIHIKQGDKLSDITEELENRGVVKSGSFLRSTITFLDKDTSIPVGDYYFDRPMNIYRVAYMLATGTHNVDPIKITFPEGITRKEIADLLAKKIPDFDKEKFLKETKDMEGYLFPDTYFFFPLTTVEEIVSQMKNNFDKNTKDLLYGKENVSDIVIMASIVELEAKDGTDAPIIAGILWKRLELGMPLQVDVWKETYKKKGLPERPIANPGVRAIGATVNKEETPYLYYLHAKDGTIYLAKTYTEHKKNISKYLK